MNLEILALASISAIALKLTIFWFSRDTIKIANPALAVAILALLCMNSFELLGFFYVERASHPLAHYGVLCYYLFVELFLLSLAALVWTVTRPPSAALFKWLSAVFVIFTLVIFWPGFAILGVRSIGYSLTRIAGPYYFLVPILLLGSAAFVIGAMTWFSLKPKKYETRRSAQTLLLSFSPMLLAIFVVVLLMMSGAKINATIAFSISSIFTTLLLLKTATRHGQIAIMRLIPNTREHRLMNGIVNFVVQPELGLENAKAYIEKLMLVESLEVCGGNRAEAAKMLGINRATLYRKMKTHGMDSDS